MGGVGENVGYSDANYNWLGGSWSDSYGSGMNTVQELTNSSGSALELDLNNDSVVDITIADGASYRVESGSFKPAGATSNESEYPIMMIVSPSLAVLTSLTLFDSQCLRSSWNVTTSVDTSAILLLSDNLTAVTVDSNGNAEAPGGVKIRKVSSMLL